MALGFGVRVRVHATPRNTAGWPSVDRSNETKENEKKQQKKNNNNKIDDIGSTAASGKRYRRYFRKLYIAAERTGFGK